MSFSREFIVDTIKTHDAYYGYVNAIAIVSARWKITNSQYPNGCAYHCFMKELDVDSLTPACFLPIEDVSNEQLEQWCIADMSPNTIAEIELMALIEIKRSHAMQSLTTYYQNPEVPPPFQM
jgi:hypothetical protein